MTRKTHETSTLSHRAPPAFSAPTAPGTGCPARQLAKDQSFGRPDGRFDTTPEHRRRQLDRRRPLRRGHRAAVGPGPCSLVNDAILVTQEINGLWSCEMTVVETSYPTLPGHGHRPRRRVAQPSHQRHRIGRANMGAYRRRPAHRIPGRPDHRRDRSRVTTRIACCFSETASVCSCWSGSTARSETPPSTGRRTSSPATASPATARPPSRNAKPADRHLRLQPPRLLTASGRSDRTANRARLKRWRTRSR